MKSMQSKIVLLPFFMWLGFLIIIPMALIFYYAFTVTNNGVVVFSLENVGRMFDPIYMSIFARSLWLAVIGTAICLLLAYPVAVFLAREENRSKSYLLLLFILPMWMNFLLRTYAWLTLLENTGLVNQLLEMIGLPKQQFLYNESAVVLGMVYNLLPYMIFPIYSSISKIPKNMLEAASDLGANNFVRFWRVTFPCSIPGVLSGITMVFVPSITSFAISKLLGGGKVPLIGDIIEQQFRVAGDWHFGAILSVLVMAVIMIGMYITNKFTDDNDREVNVLW